MLSLAFEPARIEIGRPTDVDLVITNTGDSDLFSIRLVARFPPMVRVHQRPQRIEVPRIVAGKGVSFPFVLVGGQVDAAADRSAMPPVSFPVLTYHDAHGKPTRQMAELPLELVGGNSRSADVQVEMMVEDGIVVGRWSRARLVLRTLGVATETALDVEISGEAEFAGPTRVVAAAGSLVSVEGSLRFSAAGTAVPLLLKLTGTTADGQYVETEIQEFVTVGESSEGTSEQHVYNIGKVEGNVGPGGSFTQNNVGGVVGRSSSDAINNVDAELLAGISHLLAMEEVAGEEHVEDRSTIEAFVQGDEVDREDARSAVRRILDRSTSVRDALIASGMVQVIQFAANAL